MTNRADHSVSIFTLSDNCVWLLITGGDLNFRRLSITKVDGSFVTGPDSMMIVELGMYNMHVLYIHEHVLNQPSDVSFFEYSKVYLVD